MRPRKKIDFEYFEEKPKRSPLSDYSIFPDTLAGVDSTEYLELFLKERTSHSKSKPKK